MTSWPILVFMLMWVVGGAIVTLSYLVLWLVKEVRKPPVDRVYPDLQAAMADPKVRKWIIPAWLERKRKESE